MDKPQFVGWLEFYLEKAKIMLAERKTVSAIIFFHAKDNVALFPCCEFMRSPDSKDMLAFIGKRIAEKMAADSVFLISEMWMAEYYCPDGPTKDTLPPSKIPERREAIMVTGEAKIDGKVERAMRAQFFHKKGAGDPDEEIVFGEKREFNGAGDSRFLFL